MTTMLLKVNQDDKPMIIEDILKFYKKGWEGYDQATLREQIKDIKSNLNDKELDLLTKEQLINLLLNEDRNELNEKSYYELKKEIHDYQTKTF